MSHRKEKELNSKMWKILNLFGNVKYRIIFIIVGIMIIVSIIFGINFLSFADDEHSEAENQNMEKADNLYNDEDFIKVLASNKEFNETLNGLDCKYYEVQSVKRFSNAIPKTDVNVISVTKTVAQAPTPNEMLKEELPLEEKEIENEYVIEDDEDTRISCYTNDSGYEIYNIPFKDEYTTSKWEDFDEYVYELCDEYEYITPAFIYAICRKESSFHSNSYSSAKCVGLMQLMPCYQTARMEKLGCTNLFDPYQNLRVGCYHYNNLIREYGFETAIKVYGWGGANVDKECYQASMQYYINKVYEYMEVWELNYRDDYEQYLVNKEN